MFSWNFEVLFCDVINAKTSQLLFTLCEQIAKILPLCGEKKLMFNSQMHYNVYHLEGQELIPDCSPVEVQVVPLWDD